MTLTTNVLTAEAVTDVPTGSNENPDDSGHGWAMFLSFITAALGVTFAICVLALAPSWWMLGVVVAAQWVITAMMMIVIYGVFEAGEHPDPEPAESRTGPAVVAQITDLAAHRSPLATHH